MAIHISPNLAHVALLAVVLSAGCDSKPKEDPQSAPAAPPISSEDRQLLDRMKAKEKARSDLESTPDKFIKGGQWSKVDKGIINDYSKATSLNFTNTSQFDVSGIEGHLTYIGADNAEIATVPFKAEGQVLAGATTSLPITAGEVTGNAQRARVTVEKVHVPQ